MQKVKVGVIGHTGRLGKPLVAILRKHPKAEIVYTESRSEGRQGALSEAEIVFLALPYGESFNHIRKLGDKRIIDLSIDHRDDNNWVYGLSEIFRTQIKDARLVANPGCYATSILLALYPIRKDIMSIRISATSGISGAGIAQKMEDNFLVYKEGNEHPQIKEVSRIIDVKDILFVPQRIDSAERGIVSTIFVNLNKRVLGVEQFYKETYKHCQFVNIRHNIETKRVISTNLCEIKVMEFIHNETLIISTIDNIIKGGAGQAVQNFNLMYRFNETLGLI